MQFATVIVHFEVCTVCHVVGAQLGKPLVTSTFYISFQGYSAQLGFACFSAIG